MVILGHAQEEEIAKGLWEEFMAKMTRSTKT